MRYTLEEIIQQIGQAREVLEESEIKELYLSCLTEMADEVISDMLIGAWSDPGLLEKWSGTPWHYKRLQNALSQIALAALPEGSRIFIYVSERDTWAIPSFKVYCPVPGDPENRDTALLDAYVPYALSPSDDDGKRVFRLIEDEAVPASPDFPAFAEIMDACDSTYASKRERDKMLENAISAARSLTAERSLGFTTLRNEIESRHFEF